MTKTEALSLYRAAVAGAGQPGARKRWRLAAHALAPLTDDQEAAIAYGVACVSHRRCDWRHAAKLLAAAIDRRSDPAPVTTPKAPKAPMTLCQYLASAGGLCDAGGDLKAMGADKWHVGKRFQRRLVRPDGLGLDHAADLAWERGYFPVSPGWAPDAATCDNYHPVTIADLLAAIDRELSGRPVYPLHDADEWTPHVEPEPEDHDDVWLEAHPGDISDEAAAMLYEAWAHDEARFVPVLEAA